MYIYLPRVRIMSRKIRYSRRLNPRYLGFPTRKKTISSTPAGMIGPRKKINSLEVNVKICRYVCMKRDRNKCV